MSSSQLGNESSEVEITNISSHGVWLLVHDEEFFLPYEEFPWFKDSTLSQIQDVQLLSPGHLYWEELDMDVSLSSIREPNRYPLKADASGT